AGLFGSGPESLAAAYERLLESGRFKLELALSISKEIDAILNATAATGKPADYTLPREIQQKLKPVLDELQAKFNGGMLQLDVAELRNLDQQYLLDAGHGKPHYAARSSIYEMCAAAFPAQSFSATLDLLGREWKDLAEIVKKAEEVRTLANAYSGA